MRFAVSAIIVGSLASTAIAAANPGFDFPDAVPVAKRQTSGPSYECHASCGYAIKNSATDGYCKDQSWVKLLDDCLNCALKYNIWQYYGEKVGAAAKKCGLDSTPKPVEGGGSSKVQSSTAAPSTTPVTTGAQQTTSPGQTTSGAGQSSQAPAPSTTPVVPTTGPTTVAPGTNSTTSGTPPVTAGGSQNMLSGLIVVGIAALAAANLC
ncbi:hypothetical protein VFPPC_13982 [Pochonia chlamydosporia 170]|uniref:Uncharacterized protein n=1 Tax=Pochonia chlamydosporia 170 TaxID=1380566 RepID=A0A179FIF5_METCM|nr:hypothetical protein VFPPC_13982 [Pochonia chlamydosporia 170]OAQ65021.1 hypothetical protein VFPPC_13982 [Pochonia chlamydosporia 170]